MDLQSMRIQHGKKTNINLKNPVNTLMKHVLFLSVSLNLRRKLGGAVFRGDSGLAHADRRHHCLEWYGSGDWVFVFELMAGKNCLRVDVKLVQNSFRNIGL